MRDDVLRSLADAEPRPFWLSQPGAPEPGPPLEADEEVDLVVIAGGLTGLWTALLVREPAAHLRPSVCHAPAVAAARA